MTDPRGRFRFDRREFLRLAGLAAAALASACPGRNPNGPDGGDAALDGGDGEGDAGAGPDGVVDAGTPDGPAAGLPHLGGAPNTPQGRTIAAFVDTVIPGRWRDTTGAPGGIDAGVPGLFFDPELPALRFLPLLVLILDALAREEFAGRRFFSDLTVTERDRALEAGMARVPELEFAVQLAKLAFFSTHEAGMHLRYPGPNRGYVTDPDFSFGDRALAREITPDGNLP